MIRRAFDERRVLFDGRDNDVLQLVLPLNEFRSFVDDRQRNHFPLAIVKPRQLVDFGFQYVANHGEPAIRVAVEGAVTKRQF